MGGVIDGFSAVSSVHHVKFQSIHLRVIFVSNFEVVHVQRDDAAHTNTYLSYGTSSDDANVGKWVQYAAATHGLDVKYIHNSKLLWCPKGPLKKGGRLACKIETLKTVSEED